MNDEKKESVWTKEEWALFLAWLAPKAERVRNDIADNIKDTGMNEKKDTRTELSDETAAMREIYEALRDFDEQTRERMLTWVKNRLSQDQKDANISI